MENEKTIQQICRIETEKDGEKELTVVNKWNWKYFQETEADSGKYTGRHTVIVDDICLHEEIEKDILNEDDIEFLYEVYFDWEKECSRGSMFGIKYKWGYKVYGYYKFQNRTTDVNSELDIVIELLKESL